MWYIGENIISKNNNLNNIMLKKSFYEISFWQKNYNSFKWSKHIGSLIHDFTQISLWMWTFVLINIWDIFVSNFQMTIISNHYACFGNAITPHYSSH
jgi:hypothetical protein